MNVLQTLIRCLGIQKFRVFRNTDSNVIFPLNILEEIGRRMQGNILDIGTADGLKLENLLRNVEPSKVKKVLALEPLAIPCKRAQERFKDDARVAVSNLVFERADLPSSSLDVILMFEVLEHLYNQNEALQKISQLLKPNGVLIGSTPNKWIYRITAYLIGKKPEPTHVSEMSYRETIRLLTTYFDQCKFLGFIPCMALFRKFPMLSGINKYLGFLFSTRTVYFFASEPIFKER